MSSMKLIISDLHLAGGDAVFDGFGAAQKLALEGLLGAASPSGTLGQAADDVELIINGDCFDFLVIAPLQKDGAETSSPTSPIPAPAPTTDVATALGKLEKVVAAHEAFFELLGEFVAQPRRRVTFITGNHDIELCFEEVRRRIAEAIHGQADKSAVGGIGAINRPLQAGETQGGLQFCTARCYRPLPDVYIEHGNQYDFWNHDSGIWDHAGQPLTLYPGTLRLPIGSQYVLRAGHAMNVAYPYFDRLEPSLNMMHQIALLCLINPGLVRATAERVMGMLSYPRKALADLAAGDEGVPTRLFEHAMLDFAAYQQDMVARSPEWKPTEEHPHSVSAQQNDAIMEFLALRDALALPVGEAIAAICTPKVYEMGESVAKGMQEVLKSDPALRYAIAGHTHMWRIDRSDGGKQTYFNTGTWTTRVALPTAGEITPALIDWLRQPDWENIPLRDVTQFTFVMIAASGDGPSEASLCAWEGGANGSYRVLG